MYTDHRFPALLNPLSTQTLQFYVLALLFSGIFALGCGAAYAAARASRGRVPAWNWPVGLVAFGTFAVVQLVLSFRYWHRRHRELVNRSNSGKEA